MHHTDPDVIDRFSYSPGMPPKITTKAENNDLKCRIQPPLVAAAAKQWESRQRKMKFCSPRLGHILGLLFATLCLASVAAAQNTNSGEIRGTVTDPTGAVIPGAKVTVLNVDTGVSLEYATNGDGVYTTVSILPGNYSVTFTKAGFKELKVGGIVLQVGAAQAVNGQLTVGVTTTEIDVTAETPLLQTEAGDQSTHLSAAALEELPNVGREWSNITGTLPGAVGNGDGVSLNGVEPYEANFLQDGASSINPHSANNDDTMLASVDDVQIETSNYSAEYGTGGVVFNQVTKGGTNQWHGTAYEYDENDMFNSRSWNTTSVNNLRYNQFGGTVGGPVMKNHLFFFFNAEKTIDNGAYYNHYITVPTPEMEQGLFSVAEFGTPSSTQPTLGVYDPNTAVLQPVGSTQCTTSPVIGGQTQYCRTLLPVVTVNGAQYYSLTAAGYTLDPVALAVQKFWPAPNPEGQNGANAFVNNFGTSLTNQYPWMKYFGRADYQINNSNRLTFSVMEMDNPNVNPNYDVVDSYVGDVTTDVFQISDVWTFGPALFNELRLGFHREDDHYAQDTLGKNYPTTLGWKYSQVNMFPNVAIGGNITGYGIGGTNPNAIYAQNTIDPGDTLSWIVGKHALHFGGEVLMFKDNDTPWGDPQPGQVQFYGNYTGASPNSSFSVEYADFLLGDVSNFNSRNSPINGMREIQPQFFAQDDYKVSRNLTVNLGLRYQILTGWREKKNQIGDFDPTLANPNSNGGPINSSGRGAMWFAPNNGRTQLQQNVYDIVLPRLGFAWSTFHQLVVRGGFGMFPSGWSEDYYSSNVEGFGASTTCGITDTTGLHPVMQFDSGSPNLNCSVASKVPDAYNGQGVQYYPYDTKVETSYEWSLSVERELTQGIVAEIGYVGNHTVNMPYNGVDFDQVAASELATSYANPTTAQSLRPYPQYTGVNANVGNTNAIGNYDALQLSVKKRLAHGLLFDTNFTWSKMLNDMDSSGWSGNGGNTTYQNAYVPASNYGLSNQDRKFGFNADAVYDLPFGKGRTFLNHGAALDYIAGGWQASGIFYFRTGQPYTMTMNNNLSGDSGDSSWYPNVVGNPKLSNPTTSDWFNLSAFQQPTPGTWGDERRNFMIGPNESYLNFSMAKSFPIPKLETGAFQIRLDANNVLNHTSFKNPNATVNGGSEGQIQGTTVSGRVLQLGGKFSF